MPCSGQGQMLKSFNMTVNGSLHFILALITCLLPITYCNGLFQIGTRELRLLDILLTRNGTSPSEFRYPIISEINYSTVNSKDKPENGSLERRKFLSGIKYFEQRHDQRRIQQRQQKQEQRRNDPSNKQDLQAFFLSKCPIQYQLSSVS